MSRLWCCTMAVLAAAATTALAQQPTTQQAKTQHTKTHQTKTHQQPAPATVQKAAQDMSSRPLDGARIVKECLACHAIGKGAAHKLGPVLNGLEGRKAGTIKGYTFSDAFKASGLTWTEADFAEFIANPKAKMPGTKMMYFGIKDKAEVAALWAYLRQFDADGKPRRMHGGMAGR